MEGKKAPIAPVVLLVVTGVVYSSPSNAQIVTDGSLGAQVTLNGIDVDIVETLGTRSGDNLFHSFETFNIQADGTVTFTGASDINNVISRVTGGEVSNIDGVLRSEVGSANFFFINPAGVAFGEGGSVDVPASFHLSTAEELRFVDGTVLSASTTATSTLSMAAPEAFGFLGNNAGSINIEGGSIVIGSGSGSPDNITLSANSLFVSETANVTTPGAIRIAAVGDAEASIDLETGAQSPLEGELLVNGLVGLVPPADAPNNILAEAGTIEITGPESGLATGAEGTTQVISRDLVVSDGGDIFSQGSVDIQVLNQVSVLDGGQISTIAFGEEGAGDLEISAANLLIDGLGSDSLTGVFSTGLMGTTGDTGGIDVAVTETAIIQDGGLIRSANAGSGDAGNICLLYTSPSPRDATLSRMPSSA